MPKQTRKQLKATIDGHTATAKLARQETALVQLAYDDAAERLAGARAELAEALHRNAALSAEVERLVAALDRRPPIVRIERCATGWKVMADGVVDSVYVSRAGARARAGLLRSV